MFFFLSKILDLFLSPYTWALALIVAATPWRRRSIRRWRRRRLFGVAALAVLFTFSLYPVTNGLLWRLEHSATSTYHDDVTYDAVVLLGGIVDEEVTATSGQPAYNDNVERVLMTHRLLRDGKARVVIVSGAAMDPRFTAFGEAVVLGRQLEDWGIARDRILIEDRSRNTRENAVYSQQMARAHGFERVLVVTSAFHMRRAAECFAAVDMKVDTLSVDYRAREHVPMNLEALLPRVQNLAGSTAVIREVTGRLIYRAQGYAKSVP